MRFPINLEHATLLRRYKRFLADVRLPDGNMLTIHCANSGSMRSCSESGSPVCFSTSNNPKRKYPQTLEMVWNGETWIGVNTSRTNSIVAEALADGIIQELVNFDTLQREVNTSQGSRLDILLKTGEKKTYVEVKNCSLVENGIALFPDAVTARGTKHLKELCRLVKQGHRGVIFFLVQRSDAERFSPAMNIDLLYAKTLSSVHALGVEILAYQAQVQPESIEIVRKLPVILG